MSWLMDGDSGRWVEDVPEPGVWMGGGGDAPAFFVPTYAPQYEGGGGDAPGWAMPLSPAFLEQLQQQQQQDITPSFGGLPTNAQGSAFPVSPTSQLSTNPDRTQPFNFVANPLVSDANPFSKPINNAIQSYLGRPANASELAQYSQILAKNPDDYGFILNKIQNSPEAASAILQGKQKLIIDPRQGDMTNMWLNASYGLFKPTEESGLSKITNAIGSAIPYAALGIMTGGLGTAAGLGGAAAGALGGSVAGGTRGVMEGQNALQGALIGGALGGLGGAASQYLSGSPSLSGANTGTNIASGGLDLGTNFTFNLPSAPSAYPSLDFDPSITRPPLYKDYFGIKYPIQTGGEYAYTGTGLNPAIENFYGYEGINPNLQYTTSGLANNAEALAYSSGIPIDRATFAGRGGLTGEQAAALDRAITRADYPGGEPYFPDEFPALPKGGLPFDISKLVPLAPLGIGAISKLVNPQTPAIVPPMTSGGQSYAPKGQVDYRPILDLLAPRQISRNLI